jgi:sodium-dependent dicarboxylate transporter 2/3/5
MNIISIIFLTLMVYYFLPIIWDFNIMDFSQFTTTKTP